MFVGMMGNFWCCLFGCAVLCCIHFVSGAVFPVETFILYDEALRGLSLKFLCLVIFPILYSYISYILIPFSSRISLWLSLYTVYTSCFFFAFRDYRYDGDGGLHVP